MYFSTSSSYSPFILSVFSCYFIVYNNFLCSCLFLLFLLSLFRSFSSLLGWFFLSANKIILLVNLRLISFSSLMLIPTSIFICLNIYFQCCCERDWWWVFLCPIMYFFFIICLLEDFNVFLFYVVMFWRLKNSIKAFLDFSRFS